MNNQHGGRDTHPETSSFKPVSRPQQQFPQQGQPHQQGQPPRQPQPGPGYPPHFPPQGQQPFPPRGPQGQQPFSPQGQQPFPPRGPQGAPVAPGAAGAGAGYPAGAAYGAPLGPQPGYAPAPQKKSNAGVIIAVVLAVILLLAAIGAAAYFLLGTRGDKESSAAGQAQWSTAAPATTAESTLQELPPRPAHPVLPGYSAPANEAARSNRPGGDFNNVYVGSTVTSEQFANNVRDAYVRNYLDSGELNTTITVHSPVTGRDYTMTCRDNGEYVRCTGGNNAVVYIV